MNTLVYVYGCRAPLSGLDWALAERARCAAMWDDLVHVDHAAAAEELSQARIDDETLDRTIADILRYSELLRDDPSLSEIRAALRTAFRERNRLLSSWRKEHREWRSAANERRVAAVVAIRKQYTTDADDPIYWGNSNRVLRSYDTGRQVAAKKGRLLRRYDPERDDGVLEVQIQRTRSGLGAAVDELNAGACGVRLDTSGRESVLLMRVDAAGHVIELPCIVHRALPPGSRIKRVQLTWRRIGPRTRWQVCLTLQASGLYAPMRTATASTAVPVEFDWQGQAPIEVMRIGTQVWRLPETWCRRLDTAESMQRELDAAIKTGRERYGLADGPWIEMLENLQRSWNVMDRAQVGLKEWYRYVRRLWKSRSGLVAHTLGARREMYRLWSRDVASRYAALQLPDLDISVIAREERGEDRNSIRQRAAVHTLRQELVHQCTKAGTPVFDASGRQVNAPQLDKASAWGRRKRGKLERSRTQAQAIDLASP